MRLRKIIIVDDKKYNQAAFPRWIAVDIEELTGGRYAAELLTDVIITEALPDIKKLVQKIRDDGDTVKGLLVDFVDETHKILNAGAVLLRQIKADPQLRKIPVVIYTGRDVLDFSPAALVKAGAKTAFRRRRNPVKQVLDAFGIPYKGGTNSTGPRKDE